MPHSTANAVPSDFQAFRFVCISLRMLCYAALVLHSTPFGAVLNRSRIQIAKADIIKYFDGLPNHVLKIKDIRKSFSDQKAFWRLSQNTTATHFISFLQRNAKLKEIEIPFPQRSLTCYTWGDVSILETLLGLKPNLHFSHYTAMRINGLTEQTPNTIYITDERKQSTPVPRKIFTQSEIDNAFQQPYKISQNHAEYANKKIFLLYGKDTGHLGVIEQKTNDDDGQEVNVRVTNIERTLIDCTVRPVYAGGIYEVAKAYELAKDLVSVNKLVAMLRKLDFSYPYHQAIGYYLERANYKSNQLDLVRRLPMDVDFYLTHQEGNSRYDKKWRLFVPEGF
jgi:hypothetical protein